MTSLGDQKLWGALPRATTADVARMTPEVRKKIKDRLAKFLPADRLLSDPDRLLTYSYDATGERHRPDLVVILDTVAEAVKVLEVAQDEHAIVIARGSGSNLSGGTMPVVGGIILAFSRLKGLLELDLLNRRVVIEPGMVNADLQNRLRTSGFFYAPDPSSHRIATIGGNVAENSGGPHCVKYGVTTNHVLALDVLMANGTLRRTPQVGVPRNGLDWTGLLVGSEGTLAMVVEVMATITPLPMQTRTMLSVFSSLDDAVRCVAAIVAAKIVPATLELLDRASVAIIEPFVHAGYPLGAEAVLLMEVDGDDTTVENDVRTIRRIAEDSGAVEFRLAQTAEEADALWKGRRAHYGAAARLAPHLWVQDVTVPRPRLPEMMRDVMAIGERYGFQIFTVAHVGDGNLHPVITYDPADPEAVDRMRKADHEILKACVRYGGSITGEHGIGIDKADNLSLMYTDDELRLMQGIKDVWDPENRMNPLKAIMAPHSPSVEPPSVSLDLKPFMRPESIAEGQELVLAAYHQRQSLTIRGYGNRGAMWAPHSPGWVVDVKHWNRIIDFDKENLTIEIEAGYKASDLAQLLEGEGLYLPGVHQNQPDTVGGLVAANVRTLKSAQSWRDWVLGAAWIDGRGRRLQFGRKTMKNVAGYDVSKLAPGSEGRLGILTSLILRLQPIPVRPWAAIGVHPTPHALLAFSQELLQKPWRPAMVVVVRDDPAPWSVWMAGTSEAAQAFVTKLADRHQISLNFLPEAERVPSRWEAIRDGWWASAVAQRRYADGYVLPSQLGSISKSGISDDCPVVLFPYTGTYEVYGSVREGILGLVNRVEETSQWRRRTEEWGDIEAATLQLFDPRGVFRSDKDVAHGV